jgi:hypothetical protein
MTDTPEIKSSPLTCGDVCKLFDISKDELFVLVKKGMPKKELQGSHGGRKAFRFDAEQVRAWMIENGHSGYTKTLLKNASQPTSSSEVKAQEPFKIDSRMGADGAVSRAWATEFLAFQAFLRAHKSGDMKEERARMILYVEACKGLKANATILDDRNETEKRIWFEVNEHLVKWAEPVRSLLDSMPRALAARCNPADPVMAEGVLRDWCTAQLLPMMSRRVGKEND